MLRLEGGKLCCSGAFLLTLGFLSLAPSPLLGVLAIAVGSVLFLLGTRRVAVKLSSPGVFRSFLYGFVFMFLSILAGLYAFGSLAPLAPLLFAALYVAIWYVLTEAEYLLSTLRLGRAFWEFAEYSFYMLFGSMTLVLLFIALTYVLPREVDSLLAVVLAALLTFSIVLVAMFKLASLAARFLFLLSVFATVLVATLSLFGIPVQFKFVSVLLAVLASYTLPLVATYYIAGGSRL